MAVQLNFSNEMSRLVRGVAIILMVAGHTMPGRIIGFAVPLFSFLVGYGYAFSHNRGPSHSASRIWHLLSYFWLILFGICLPAALLTYPGQIQVREVVANMFGLIGRFNFFCWYIYFYIAAMLIMPLASRITDRWGLAGTLAMMACFGILAYLLGPLSKSETLPATIHWYTAAYRISRYMPIVLWAYWLAKANVFSRIKLPRHPVVVIGAIVLFIGIYLLRGISGRIFQFADFAWAALAAMAIALPFNLYKLSIIRNILTQLGMKSMGIWFLHALFFTHATRDAFLPLIGWIPDGILRVVPVLSISYLLALGVDWLYNRIKSPLHPFRIATIVIGVTTASLYGPVNATEKDTLPVQPASIMLAHTNGSKSYIPWHLEINIEFTNDSIFINHPYYTYGFALNEIRNLSYSQMRAPTLPFNCGEEDNIEGNDENDEENEEDEYGLGKDNHPQDKSPEADTTNLREDTLVAINWEDDTLVISGLSDTGNVTAVRTDGLSREFYSHKGSCRIPVRTLPPGVYIFRTEGSTFKILLKRQN